MTGLAVALQTAIIQALKADAGVSAISGERVYDRVPAAAAFPYISYGEDQILADDAGGDECRIEGFEVFITLHAWSRAVGQIEVKRLGAAIRSCLHHADPAVAGHRLHSLEHDQTRYLRDPDGLTSHAVVTFRALLDAV